MVISGSEDRKDKSYSLKKKKNKTNNSESPEPPNVILKLSLVWVDTGLRDQQRSTAVQTIL